MEKNTAELSRAKRWALRWKARIKSKAKAKFHLPAKEMETFHIFSQLPIELRLLIWEEAAKIPADQHIVVNFDAEPVDPPTRKEEYTYRMGFGPFTAPLGTLSANFESREATLSQNPNWLQFFGSPRIYFNAERNIIHLDLKSIIAIHTYLRQDAFDYQRDQNGVQWAKLIMSDFQARAAELVGFNSIERLSFPPIACEVSFQVSNLLRRPFTIFTGVQQILPRSIQTTMEDDRMFRRYMIERLETRMAKCKGKFGQEFDTELQTLHMRWRNYVSGFWKAMPFTYRARLGYQGVEALLKPVAAPSKSVVAPST